MAVTVTAQSSQVFAVPSLSLTSSFTRNGTRKENENSQVPISFSRHFHACNTLLHRRSSLGCGTRIKGEPSGCTSTSLLRVVYSLHPLTNSQVLLLLWRRSPADPCKSNLAAPIAPIQTKQMALSISHLPFN
jgi:hypothetical protein